MKIYILIIQVYFIVHNYYCKFKNIDNCFYICSMDYKKIHDKIIERAKFRKIDGYIEKHHIIPKCLGGNNSKNNIVELTAKEHYIIHYLLVKIYPFEYKLAYALFRMCQKGKFTQERFIPSAKTYEYIKLLNSLATKQRLSIKNPWVGKKHTEKSKKKQSESAKNRKTTKENEDRRRNGISKNNKGKKHTTETILKLKDRKANKNPMFGKTGELNTLSKKISQYDLNGNLIKIWISSTEVQKQLNLKRGRIYSVIKSKSKKLKEYPEWKWDYHNNLYIP